MEVELGSYAATHGSYAPLRAFGKQMVRDHSKANAELLQIAESQGAKLPTTPSFTQQTDQIIVKSQKGRSFDHHYIDQMIKDHSAAIKLFQQEIDSGQNDRDKDFAKRTLPTIKMHAQMAQSVKANLP